MSIFSKDILNDKVAIVTGASRGIGSDIAKALTESGAYVVGTATSQAGANKINESLQDKGEGRVLDVNDAEDIVELIDSVNKTHNGIHVLVNNAGITKDNLLIRMKDEEWDDVLNTNLRGSFKICKSSIKIMMKQRYGRIINISSVVAKSGNPGQTNYAASKAGIIGFTKSLAKEVASRNITVNCIAPGFIATDMTDELSDDIQSSLMSGIPLQRFGKMREISNAVVFLASEGGSYITGETFNINGGMLMN
jgi:3-oxoacyl-[acyl-carrier protein] reductase